MVIEKEFQESLCQLQSPTNKLICVGKLAIIGENYIVLSKSSPEDFPPIKFLSFVKLTLKHKTGGYKVILASVTEANATSIRLSSMILLTNDERRGYFRLDMDEPTILYLTDQIQSIIDMHNDLIKENKTLEEVEKPLVHYIHVTIKNISLSGLLLQSDTFLQIGQRVYIEIMTKTGLELFAITVRRRVGPNETVSDIMELAGSQRTTAVQYGCVINEKSVKKMDKLCRTILETQAAMIQKVKK